MFKVAICDDEMTSLMINQALTEQVLEEANIEYCYNTIELANTKLVYCDE